MWKQIRPAVVLMALFSLLTGLVYPLAITGVAQLALPGPANGSLALVNGAPVGSTLIGQNFASDVTTFGNGEVCVCVWLGGGGGGICPA